MMTSKKVVIRNGKIVEEGAIVVKPNESAAKFNREHMKREFRKDLLQPTQVDFARAYPEKAKELYNEDTLRLLS